MLKKLSLAVAIGVALSASAQAKLTNQQEKNAKAFLETYSKIAEISYNDSLKDAKALQKAIDAFVANPTATTLAEAKKAWLASRETYGQTEIFRLSNGPIDAEEGWVADKYHNLEEQINAWPLDENMIDYTIGADGKVTGHNIISSTGEFTPGGEKATAVNVSKITPDVITALNQNGGDANVTSGYHAIEFLLWGQDQDYNNFIQDKVTHGPMTAGERPLSDFTSDKFAQRRLDYLKAATDKLVNDLTVVASAWAPKGEFRLALNRQLTGADASKNISYETSLHNIFVGMGTFLKSELANERIAVAVLTPSEEDEHSCFSDNTHRDIFENFQGFVNVYHGSYDGKKVGPSIESAIPSAQVHKVNKLMNLIDKRIATVNNLAKTKMHFDYQIHPENKPERNNIIRLKNELRRMGDEVAVLAKSYGVNLTSQDVTDPDENHDYEKK